MRCSSIEETSVGEALASANDRACFEAAAEAGAAILTLPVAEMVPIVLRLDCRIAFLNIMKLSQKQIGRRKESGYAIGVEELRVVESASFVVVR